MGPVDPRKHIDGYRIERGHDQVGLRKLLLHVATINQGGKEVIRQRFRPVGEHAVRSLTVICLQHAQAADQHGHLRRGQGQQLRPVDQHLFCGDRVFRLLIVAEPVCFGFQHAE